MAQPEQVRRGSLSRYTARRILTDFAARGLRPGDTLADEATLVEQYGVSRGTLREALRLLGFLGVVTNRTGPPGGPRLTRPEPMVVGRTLGMVAQFQGATLRTVFETRLVVEPATASLAAVARTDTDLQALDAVVAAMRATEERGGTEYAENAVRFIVLVAEASHNAVFATVVPALAAMTTTVPRTYARGRSELTELVTTILEAIRSGDEDLASCAAGRRIQSFVDDLGTHHPDELENPILWPDLDEVLTGERVHVYDREDRSIATRR